MIPLDSVLCLLIWIFAVILTLSGTWLSLRHFSGAARARVLPKSDAELPPLSILKPLKGVDEGIEGNLETFFRLDYPEFELLFCVAEPSDPVCAVVRTLMGRFPNVRARLTVGAVEVGPNPKVNNLVESYRSAAYDLVLISDSNIRVEPGYLRFLVSEMDPSVGIISAVVSGSNPQGLGGLLESMFLNTFYVRGMLLAAAVGKPCVVGKCMLFRRSEAARFGGIEVLGRYLAEDYMAGEAMRRLGRRVIVSRKLAVQNIGYQTFKAHWDRHVRWGRIRKVQSPPAFIGEFLTGSLISGLCGTYALSQLFGFYPSGVLAVHLAIWSACDFLVSMRIEPTFHPYGPITWFVREILAVPLWIHTACGNTVLWRGHRLRVHSGGTLDQEDEASRSSKPARP